MVILACFGIASLAVGTIHGTFQRNREQLVALGIPLALLTITLGLGQAVQGLHVFIMASIAAITAWGIRNQEGTGRWFSILATIGLGGAVCCALLLF